MSTLRPLLENLIDYAGLFPPSALPMAKAVENYARYRKSPESWMLARFVVPVARLDEFEESMAGRDFVPAISALIGGDLDHDLERIARSPFPIDTIELKAADVAQVESAAKRMPQTSTPYFEISDTALIPVIRSVNARAKIRTGGITPEAFPAAAPIAHFLKKCSETDTPFKATAGLHHPLRCHRPLTYSPDGPSGWMYGFLNVFLAAVLARRGVSPETLEALLTESSPESLADSTQLVSWGSCVSSRLIAVSTLSNR